jgi:hypothetical protein
MPALLSMATPCETTISILPLRPLYCARLARSRSSSRRLPIRLAAVLSKSLGNAIGFFALDSAIGGKWLNQIAPQLERAALTFNPETLTFARYFSDPFEVAACSFAVQPILAAVRDPKELETAIAAVGREKNADLSRCRISPPPAASVCHQPQDRRGARLDCARMGYLSAPTR